MSGYYRFVFREFLPFIVLLCGLGLLVLFVSDFREELVLPGGDLLNGLFPQLLLYGMSIGFAGSTWEEGLGTLAHATHRGMPFRRQMAWNHLVALPCLLSLSILPLGIWAVFQWSFHPDAAAADWSRLIQLVGVGTITIAAYGVGYWSGALRTSIWARLAVALLAGKALYGWGWGLLVPNPDQWSVSPVLFVVAMVATGVVFVGLGQHALRGPYDPDRPLSTGAAVLHGGVLALILSIAASQTVRGMQRTRMMSLHSNYPYAARLTESDPAELVRLSNDVPGIEGFVLVDDQHEPIAEKKLEAKYELLFSPWMHWAHVGDPVWEREASDGRDVISDGPPFEGPYKRLFTANGTQAYLDLGTGAIRAIFLSGDERARGTAVDLRPDGGRFTRQVSVLGKESRELPVLLFDEGEIWAFRVAGERAELARLPLPDGDRVQDAGTGKGSAVVEGERGIYRMVDGRFERQDAEAEAEVRAGKVKDAAERERRLMQWASIEDPLRYEVAVAWGDETRRMRYAPRTADEVFDVTMAERLALLRPPVLLAASLARPLPDSVAARATFDDATWFDPLFAGGKRASKASFVFMLALGLGLVLVLRLKKFGAPASHALGWLVVVLLFGWAGFVVGLLMETRRAWRWERTEFSPPARPLVETV